MKYLIIKFIISSKKKSLEWLIKDGNGARPDVKRLAAYQKELDAVNEILSTKVH